jgi:hypothetical protein
MRINIIIRENEMYSPIMTQNGKERDNDYERVTTGIALMVVVVVVVVV